MESEVEFRNRLSDNIYPSYFATGLYGIVEVAAYEPHHMADTALMPCSTESVGDGRFVLFLEISDRHFGTGIDPPKGCTILMEAPVIPLLAGSNM
jgi:hypothetical protein